MENFFSGTVGDIFNKKSTGVLGIDIGSSSIKIIQLSRKGGHEVLDTYGELALGPYAGKSVGEATSLPPEKIIEAIGDMLKEKEVNITTRTCGVAIPFASSLMAVIEMPMQSPKQLESMIPIEARKYIPVPISEVVLDWYIIPRDKNPDIEQELNQEEKLKFEKVEVLIVALHNDTLIRYKDI